MNTLMRWIGIVSGYLCLGLSLLIVFEILSRKLFNVSVQGVDEIGGYVVAVTGTFGMALAAWCRSHTRIDIVLTRLPVQFRAILHIISYMALAAGSTFMLYMAWSTLAETIEFKSVASTPLQTPLWIPQSLWVAGLAAFCLTAIIMLAYGIYLAVTNIRSADQFLEASTLRDEIEDVVND